MTRGALILILASAAWLLPGAAGGRPPADLPLSHWAYPLLARLASRGILDVDLTTRPVSRAAVASALERLDATPPACGAGLTAREEWLLDRLRAEFLRGEIDGPALSAEDGTASAGLGLRLLTRYDRDAFEAGGAGGARDDGPEQPDVSVDLSYDLWGGVEEEVGFTAEGDVLLDGQSGPRTERLSNRARTWRGIAAASELAYVMVERPHTYVTLGRRDLAWGRSERGGLLFSGSAANLDGIAAGVSVGALSFHALHAFLEYTPTGDEAGLGEDESIFVAAHRISVAGPSGSVSVGEAVVYSSVLPDPAYLNPLIPYYLSQHNERADDNVLWSLDFLFRPAPGLDIYGEALVDDLQYERTTRHPDKYGVTLGAELFTGAGGTDFDVLAEYTNVRKWTYTHHFVQHRFEQDGRPLGFRLGPDADAFTIGVTAHPTREWSVGVTQSLTRKGEGTLSRPFEEGEDPEPAFPSGVVETTSRLGLEVAHDDYLGPRAYASVTFVSVRNAMHGSGDDSGWEIHAGIGFRIHDAPAP